MSAMVDPYTNAVHLETMSMEDEVMKENPSQAGLESATGSSGAVDPPPGEGEEVHHVDSNEETDMEEMIDFETLTSCYPHLPMQDIGRDTL